MEDSNDIVAVRTACRQWFEDNQALLMTAQRNTSEDIFILCVQAWKAGFTAGLRKGCDIGITAVKEILPKG